MRKNKYITIVALTVFIGFIALLLLFLQTSSAYTTKQITWQMTAGEKKEYESGTKFLYGDSGPTYADAAQNEYLESNPIYTQDKSKLIVPEYMIYVNPTTLSYKQIPCFTEVITGNNSVINGVELAGGFLFDGKNTYTFLEACSIEINGKKIELAAYSTITLYNNNIYTYYDYSTDTVHFDESVSLVLKVECTGYSVDITNDVLYTEKGDKILIYNDPHTLELL